LPSFETPFDGLRGIRRFFANEFGRTAGARRMTGLRGILYFEPGWQPRFHAAGSREGVRRGADHWAFDALFRPIAARIAAIPSERAAPSPPIGEPNASDASQSNEASAPVVLPESPLLVALKKVPRIQEAAMRWAWVAWGALALLATQAAFAVVLVLMTLVSGEPLSMGVQAASLFLSFPVSGAIVAMLSPGATIREPALGGALVSGIIGLLKGSAPNLVFFATMAVTYAAIWVGARAGEALQARLARRHERRVSPSPAAAARPN
jgi:hypothetical protein